jgi:hypothetical protein
VQSREAEPNRQSADGDHGENDGENSARSRRNIKHSQAPLQKQVRSIHGDLSALLVATKSHKDLLHIDIHRELRVMARAFEERPVFFAETAQRLGGALAAGGLPGAGRARRAGRRRGLRDPCWAPKMRVQ